MSDIENTEDQQAPGNQVVKKRVVKKKVAKKRGPKPKSQSLNVPSDRGESVAARSDNREGEGRRRRLKSIGTHSSKLAVPPIEGYALRWVNDKDNRLSELYQQDWDFVNRDEVPKVGDLSEDKNSDLGNRVTQVVGVKEDGSPLRAFLMKKRKDWHENDQNEKQKSVDEVDAAIKDGSIGREQGEAGKMYTPEGADIKYESGSRRN